MIQINVQRQYNQAQYGNFARYLKYLTPHHRFKTVRKKLSYAKQSSYPKAWVQDDIMVIKL
jgi:hypothetical protein